MHTRLIFIVGAPRSGTTLLAEMLSSHPDICSSPETHYSSRYMKKYSRFTHGVQSESETNFKTIMQDIGAELLGFSTEDLQELRRRYADIKENIRSGLLAHLP